MENRMGSNPFGAHAVLTTPHGRYEISRLDRLEQAGMCTLAHLPFSLRVLLEAVLRQVDGRSIQEADVVALASWTPTAAGRPEIPFLPARVLMQDFTGVPAVVDLAAMRNALARLGGDPSKVNPHIPVDLVVDHSVQVDFFASPEALKRNAELEFQRNRERYEFLRWGQQHSASSASSRRLRASCIR
jgi:aconitate hydratase